MIISHTSEKAIVEALAAVNARFDGNICFDRFERLDQKGTLFAVTLYTPSVEKLEHRLGFYHIWSPRTRRLRHACWHVHRYFFDALNIEARIRTARFVVSLGDPWNDWNAGSPMYPQYMSELCECDRIK